MTARRLPATSPDDAIFFWLVLLVALTGVATGATHFAGAPHRNLDAYDQAARSLGAQLAGQAATVGAVLVAVRVLVRGGARPVGDILPLLLLLGAVGVPAVQELARPGSDPTWLVSAAIAMLVLVAVWTLSPSRRWWGLFGAVLLLAPALSLVYGLVRGGPAFYPDVAGGTGTSEKALIGHDLLAGVFGHSNTLGIYAALAIPFVARIRPLRWAWLGTAVGGGALVWSSSRTALIATGVGLVFVVLPHVLPRRPGRGWRATWAVATLVVAVGVPLGSWPVTAFSGRAGIWAASLRAAEPHALTGLGREWFAETAGNRTGLTDQAASAHNLVLQWLVTGGVLALVTGLLLLVLLVRRASRAPDLTPTWFVVVLLAIGTLESPMVESPRQELFLPVVVGMAVVLRACTAVAGRRTAAAGPAPGVARPVASAGTRRKGVGP
ncbi:O-antigen ligase [Cellulomonas sp. C5510]|uniref:O-antigen ligase family protein n=1 Tax=Cellulomonas sp. C5510 TaxID=2871170 RepID=UPI001C94925F|nr:O-antigen ligase family protein [Cellulomonas sp. C5510]QZN84859.1 O-antigen ligase family protein [Cellulomonas sp. C5510]